MKRAKKMLAIISTLLLAIIVACAATWLSASDESKSELLDAFSQEDTGDEECQIDWDSLPSEVIAWVEVPGTNIDSPIVQATPDAPNAYLYKDVLGQGAYGTPYIDCDCSLDSPFTMIYGHHMSDGSAFADFANFIDETYAHEHERIIVYERSGEIHYLQVVAVDIVNASRERLNIPSSEEFNDRIANCDITFQSPIEADKLCAFATCSYQTWNSRTIILAINKSA